MFLVIKIKHLEYPCSKETHLPIPQSFMLPTFKQAGINPLSFQTDSAANFLKQMAEGTASKDSAAGEGKTVPVTSTSSTCSVLVMFNTKRMESWSKFSSECSKSQNRAQLFNATVLTCIYRTFQTQEKITTEKFCYYRNVLIVACSTVAKVNIIKLKKRNTSHKPASNRTFHS